MPSVPRPILTATLLLVTGLLAGGVQAQIDLTRIGGAGDRDDVTVEQLVQTRVVTPTRRLEPGGTFEIAVIFKIARGWHIYWQHPGDAGAATAVTVRTPAGFTVGATRFPRPQTFQEPDGTTYGYEREVALFVPVTTPATFDPATPVTFRTEVFFLVCRERCLMGTYHASVTLPTPHPISSADHQVLDRFAARVPRSLPALRGTAARLVDVGEDGARLVLTIPAAGAEAVEILPIPGPGVEPGAARVERRGDWFRVELPVEIRPHNAEGNELRVRGVLGLGRDPEGVSYAFSVPVPTADRREP
ncbi:MAG: hypothetical protein HKO59_02190 [Phycisphaerales bacterium]|nr:hypothetical protein [Phycisphaerae bacterium]NNF42206.1 hypothetical protein [Phycisphaerales bacterium]NNM24792.1 hypothetical protein [Phycisphaerales bacterium]